MTPMPTVVRSRLRDVGLVPTRAVPALIACLGIAFSAVLGGCFPTAKKGFDSPDNALRIDASVRAAESGDAKAVPDLVRLLDSDDPATRLVAIRSLERITGTTLGYDHGGKVSHREEGVRRWQAWLKNRAGQADAPGARGREEDAAQ